jgi:hypothetical protein
MTSPHDITAFSDGLGAKLSARARHVCVFLGAGTSKACGLPDVAALQKHVLDALSEKQRAAFTAQLDDRGFEEALSRVRRIAALLADSTGKVDGLDAATATALDQAVCTHIIAALDLSTANLEPVLRFATWAAQCDYDLPLELFTVNYDLLIETALEHFGVPYFDGFVGTLRARFRAELVEAEPRDTADWLPTFLVRLWKLHGSVNWERTPGEVTEVVRLGGPVAGVPAAIYPSDAKYDESRRVPFVVLQDRFRRALRTPESLVLVSGYSWGDAHLNELLFDAVRRRPRSEIVAFSYSDIPPIVAERAETLPNLQAVGATEAIIGGVRAAWQPPEDDIPDIWEGDKCQLGDFGHLAGFLARSAPRDGEVEQRLLDTLAKLAAPGA